MHAYLADHGGRLERRLRGADGLTELQLVGFPSSEAFAGYATTRGGSFTATCWRIRAPPLKWLEIVDVA